MAEARRLSGGALIPIVAHQGGWDEVLMFAVPIILAIAVVWYFEQRARRDAKREDEPGE